MPIETVPGTAFNYYLIAFDKHSKERPDDDGKKTSERVLAALAQEPISDVFIISHGWLGDVPAAKSQYNAWIGAMAQQTADLEKIDKARSGFRPLFIGLHWPSKPWGDEDLTVSAAADSEDSARHLVDEYADRIADTETSKKALFAIFRGAKENSNPDTLPPEVLSAYQELDREANLGSDGDSGAPGSDWEGFDPEGIYETSLQDEQVSFSVGGDDDESSSLNKILDPLRVLSYWKMKDRARKIGETAGFNLLKTLQENAAPNVRFHLIGHSFGCIVVSSILNGPKGKGELVRPVDSLCLLQGAVSLWSYCAKVAYERDRPGYFHSIIQQKKVKGPIVATYSQHDYAVGKMYPLAGKVAFSSVDFAGSLPKYGAIGSFGLAGEDLGTVELAMLPSDATYDFQPGKIYNLVSSKYICDIEMGGPTSGAHNDIAKPEVAHVLWAAASTV